VESALFEFCDFFVCVSVSCSDFPDEYEPSHLGDSAYVVDEEVRLLQNSLGSFRCFTLPDAMHPQGPVIIANVWTASRVQAKTSFWLLKAIWRKKNNFQEYYM